MKQIKLNNVIFPIWMLLFIPPVIFIALIGNFIIDSLMQNASISFVETSMVIGVDKRTVYVPIHEDE